MTGDSDFEGDAEGGSFFSEIVRQIGVGVAAYGPDGTFRWVNDYYADLLGVAPSAIEGRHVSVVNPEFDREQFADYWDGFEAGETRRHDTLHRRLSDGSTVPVSVITTCTEIQGTRFHVGTIEDVSERKERERELKGYRRLVENLPIGVYRTTPGTDGEFLLVNRGLVEMLDAPSKARFYDGTVGDIYSDPDALAEFSERLLSEGAIDGYEMRVEPPHGESMWCEVSATAVEEDGRSVFECAMQDITARKESEQRLEEQRDDLELLNQVVRHDIRNDLQLIVAHADMLEEHVDPDGREYLRTLKESAESAIDLTRTARELAEIMLQTDVENDSVPLATCLEEQVEDLTTSYENVEVRIVSDIPETAVVANEMLESVFGNLLTNAVQHNDKQVPEVEVSAETDGDTVRVRIADNGPGIPDEGKQEVFGKGEKGLESPGSGIGLYLVNSLVESYGGDVRVEDNDPDGAVFIVELMAAPEE